MHLAQFVCLLLIGIHHITPVRGRSEIDVDILARLEALERQVSTQNHQLDLQNDLIATHRSLITDLQGEIASHKTTIQKLEETNVEQQAELQQQKTNLDQQQRRVLQLEVALHTANGETPDPDMTVVDAILAKPGLQDVDKKGASLIQTERNLDVSEDNDFNKDIADKHPNLKARLHECFQSFAIPSRRHQLSTDPDLLKLEWVLRMVAKRLSTVEENKFCVVDFMPNLKWMLNNMAFIKECATEFKVFEEQYPISFVIHFVVPKEKVLSKIETDSTKHSSSTPPSKQEGSRQSDEADSSRTQKRVILFQNSVKNFMEYFEKRQKIVTIDVSCGLSDVIWNKICDFFAEFNFKASKSPETVIVFGFGCGKVHHRL